MNEFKIIVTTTDTRTGSKIDEIEMDAKDIITATREFYRIRNSLNDIRGLMKSAGATRYDMMIIQRGENGEWSLFQGKRITI